MSGLSMDKKKILIAYYSRKGENYCGGQIIELKQGNTQIFAKKIQKLTNGTLFEIKTVKDYPKKYSETTKVAMDELRIRARPDLSEYIDSISSYDIIFLGYPNWWGTMPMPVYTFLEDLKWKGKRIIPFCTHEGSGLSDSVRDIKKSCLGAKVDEGFELYGHSVHLSMDIIEKWISKLL